MRKPDLKPLTPEQQRFVREEVRELVREMFKIMHRSDLDTPGDPCLDGEQWNVHFEPFSFYAGLWMDDDDKAIVLQHAAECRIGLRKRIEAMLEDLGLLDRTASTRRGPHFDEMAVNLARTDQ